MASSTILRVKRKREENPQEALVLMCKRTKTDIVNVVAPNVFVFQGTVGDQNFLHLTEPPIELRFYLQELGEISKVIPKSTQYDRRNNTETIRTLDKLRKRVKEQTQQASSQNRYEIVNCHRGLENQDTSKHINLVDLQQSNDNTDKTIVYEYDIYTSIAKDFSLSDVDDYFRVVTVRDDNSEVDIDTLITELLNEHVDDEQESNDDDDSNDENNYKNDYPDTDVSDDEELVRAVARTRIEDDLSSDDDLPSSPARERFEHDASLFGLQYARYKARLRLREDAPLDPLLTSAPCDEGYKAEEDGFFYGEEDDERVDNDGRSSSEEYMSD